MLRVPRRLIQHLDKQIELQTKRIAHAQAYLDQLIESRKGMVPLDEEGTGKARGGFARANTLSPEKRSEIAKRAADKRWHKT